MPRKTAFFSVSERLLQHFSSKIIKKIIPTLLLFLDICVWPVWLVSPWSPNRTGSVWVVKQARHCSCDDGFCAPGYTGRLSWNSSVVSDLPEVMVILLSWAAVIAGSVLLMFVALLGDSPDSFLLHWGNKGHLNKLSSFFCVWVGIAPLWFIWRHLNSGCLNPRGCLRMCSPQAGLYHTSAVFPIWRLRSLVHTKHFFSSSKVIKVISVGGTNILPSSKAWRGWI